MNRHRILGTMAALALLAGLASPAPAWADDPPPPPPVPRASTAKVAEVPNLFGARLAQANAIVRQRGLLLGTVYEISKERMYAYLKAHVPKIRDPETWTRNFERGKVFSQLPPGGTRLRAGSAVDIVLIATNDGKVPADPRFSALEILALPEAARDAIDKEAYAKRKDRPAPITPAVTGPKRPDQPTGPVAPPPADDRPAPIDPAPVRPQGGDAGPGVRATPRPGAAIAEGSPEAPRSGASIDKTKVPTFVGLDLVDATTLARETGLELYVERVAGHPAGRILTQVPAGGTAKPQGNVVKLRVTAGGDFEAASPGAPALYVEHVHVPDVLDRTKLQARRILEAVGLKVSEVPAKHGMPGRVVDLKPAAGQKVVKGSVVELKIGPGKLPGPLTGPYRPPAASTGNAPASTGSIKTVGGDANIPRPIAPAAGTPLPSDKTIPMGFSWSKVKNATAYVIEVEEQVASGAWMANARKPVRTTAVTLELERLDTKMPRAFRWRVLAVFGDQQGRPSKWVPLR